MRCIRVMSESEKHKVNSVFYKLMKGEKNDILTSEHARGHIVHNQHDHKSNKSINYQTSGIRNIYYLRRSLASVRIGKLDS